MSRTLDRVGLNFHKMPQVVGDPVVESGSNADGYWTKWADGTVIMSASVPVPDNNNTGTDFTFPQAVVSTGADLSIAAGGTGNASGGTASSFAVETGIVNTTSGRTKALIHTATTITNPNTTVRVSIKGRWK